MKRNYTLSLDEETTERFKALFPNQFSPKVNDLIINSLSVAECNTTGVNIQLTKLKINKLQNESAKIKTELDLLNAQVEAYNKEIEQKKEADLQKQKLELERQINCHKCNRLIEGKTFRLRENNYCNSCFQSL